MTMPIPFTPIRPVDLNALSPENQDLLVALRVVTCKMHKAVATPSTLDDLRFGLLRAQELLIIAQEDLNALQESLTPQ